MGQTPFAPGWPGLAPRWTSSAKSGIGTALGVTSRVWFTLSHGIVNEIYYPRIDQACVRDMGLIVTDGSSFFSEEKLHTTCEVVTPVEGVPAYRVTTTCVQGRYRIRKEILTDPDRDVLLQRISLTALGRNAGALRLHVLLAPHLGNRGGGNTAWIGEDKGAAMLFAEREDVALALACSVPWRWRSAGFVGESDGWQDLVRHGRLTWAYERAQDGNVALVGELDLAADGDEAVLALGFGLGWAEASYQARASLAQGFEACRDRYVAAWQSWHRALIPLDDDGDPPGPTRTSRMVLRIHEAKHFPGGGIASLSIPWGQARGDDDLGGYHLVWPRDLVEVGGGFLACGAHDDARRVLAHLALTQEADGHWPQNMWLDGRPYWTGVQMDETALPVLLVDLAAREGALDAPAARQLWPMVRRAAGFLARGGPVTPQDRWEEDPGYSPFTLAVEIAALLVGADLAEQNHEPALARYLRETADLWNEGIESWTYVAATELAERFGVRGYYVRIAPVEESDAASPAAGFVAIKNRPPGESSRPAAAIVSPDALALVRFGLRDADDPRIRDTVTVIDALLKLETPQGPFWHRYNGDGYGEHEDGAPFDGLGIGRAWPLLTGERAHYELAAGRVADARRLLRAMEASAGDGGLLPEQIWDAPDVPERELRFGRPSGSAMPLVWAHAEHLKLRRSLRDRRVYDMPPQTRTRYAGATPASPYAAWRFNHKRRDIPAGRVLRIEISMPAVVRWSADGWATAADISTTDTGVGMHVADLDTRRLPPRRSVTFTFRWHATGGWEGTDYSVLIR